MSVGLVLPTLEQCIKLCLLIIIVSGIITRSWELLLIVLSFPLICGLYALIKFLYKTFKPEFGTSESVEESDDHQEDGQD